MSKNVIKGKNYRITILTQRLIRLEYSKSDKFEDRKTFRVVNRDFPEVDFTMDKEKGIAIDTGKLLLTYDEKEFSANSLMITVKQTGETWNFGMGHGNWDGNLLGTARTLDNADGAVDLEPGIFGRKGYAAFDDSKGVVVLDNGEIENRTEKCIDTYFFGYGNDYFGGLSDFYKLCGKTPLIPRYALGNWWSRYYRYTEDSYVELLDKFKEENIPLSVAVIDMDWHITEIDPKYGTGWTGFTWNEKLFPDYRRFLKTLHERKLATTLNLHPADGIRGFEKMYKSVAGRLGLNTEEEEPAEFDFGNKAFRKAYFDEVIHPYENDGVDFWWIDWQQGTGKTEKDVDPLILLNHYHYLDQENRNIRPMIFSRYAGIGSHRYPVGFSGDTKTTWKSLDYQPFFTSTASNVGYGWWSHDIGGHMLGDKNDERLLRWVQFGVFSPIMRLHSSCSDFANKEPWVLAEPYHGVIANFMRLRHAMIPYLYTENHRAFAEDKPLVRPMYYELPDVEEAYTVPTEYGFGNSLVVGAITRQMDEETRLASVNMVLPEGRSYDIFNGRIYQGTTRRKLYRGLGEIPVLLKEGAIVPMSENDTANGTDNPENIKLLIGAGKSGEYTMYEDDGISMAYRDGKYVTTRFEVSGMDGTLTVGVDPCVGDDSLIPSVRNYEICIYGVEPEDTDVLNCIKAAGGEISKISYDSARRILTVSIMNVRSAQGAKLEIQGLKLAQNDYRKLVFDILEKSWITMVVKDSIYNALMSKNTEDFLSCLKGADVSENLKDAIFEVFLLSEKHNIC